MRTTILAIFRDNKNFTRKLYISYPPPPRWVFPEILPVSMVTEESGISEISSVKSVVFEIFEVGEHAVEYYQYE